MVDLALKISYLSVYLTGKDIIFFICICVYV